jgi:hypothetical protein
LDAILPRSSYVGAEFFYRRDRCFWGGILKRAAAYPLQAAYIEGVVHHLLLIFRLRQKSLVRAILLSLGAFAASLHLAGFPHIENLHGSYWQILALLVAVWGMAETARCLQRKWSFYHAGVLILLYSELMILAAIVVMLFAP